MFGRITLLELTDVANFIMYGIRMANCANIEAIAVIVGIDSE
jgi:hypothetical protein